jgi:hypothetical protein
VGREDHDGQLRRSVVLEVSRRRRCVLFSFFHPSPFPLTMSYPQVRCTLADKPLFIAQKKRLFGSTFNTSPLLSPGFKTLS